MKEHEQRLQRLNAMWIQVERNERDRTCDKKWLYNAYQPLIGTQGCQLYDILFRLPKGQLWSKDEVWMRAGVNAVTFLQAEMQLERVGLLQSQEIGTTERGERVARYVVKAPIQPSAFFETSLAKQLEQIYGADAYAAFRKQHEPQEESVIVTVKEAPTPIKKARPRQVTAPQPTFRLTASQFLALSVPDALAWSWRQIAPKHQTLSSEDWNRLVKIIEEHRWTHYQIYQRLEQAWETGEFSMMRFEPTDDVVSLPKGETSQPKRSPLSLEVEASLRLQQAASSVKHNPTIVDTLRFYMDHLTPLASLYATVHPKWWNEERYTFSPEDVRLVQQLNERYPNLPEWGAVVIFRFVAQRGRQTLTWPYVEKIAWQWQAQHLETPEEWIAFYEKRQSELQEAEHLKRMNEIRAKRQGERNEQAPEYHPVRRDTSKAEEELWRRLQSFSFPEEE